MTKLHKFMTFIILTAAVLVLTFRAGAAAGSQNGTPGSINDPLVTKSYLDARIEQIENGNAAVSAGMTKLTLSKGDIVAGGEGTTFVLIEGSASVSGNGIINITGGEVMGDGMTMSKYSTFLSTDSNGAIRSDSRAVMFVSGDYNVIKSSR